MNQKEMLSFYRRNKKKKDEFYSGLLTGKSKFVKKDRKQSASSTTPTTPAATTPIATTPAATTPTMPIVLIESEEVAEASSRKKQKTVAGAIKNYYSDGNVSKVFENICNIQKF